VFAGAIASGQAVEIATGAPLPDGATAVVMVEDTAPVPGNSARVRVHAGVAPGQHVGRAGADIAAHTVGLRAGDHLLPARVGVLAALGLTGARVHARPRVAIVSTGNEVVPPGTALGPGQIHDVNRTTLCAIVETHGGEALPIAVAADTLDALNAALAQALACDAIVFSGGSSVGDRDLLIDLLQGRGDVIFHGVATRPGKPTAFGHIDGRPVFGMPGNPTSCLTNAYVMLVPFLRTLAHLPVHRPLVVRAPLARRVSSAPDRTQFYTVRLVDGRAEPAFKASGDITSMAHADGYVEIAAEVTALEAGTPVDVVLF
jgi:molybdenum cofactor synthesis domain-containing protein